MLKFLKNWLRLNNTINSYFNKEFYSMLYLYFSNCETSEMTF